MTHSDDWNRVAAASFSAGMTHFVHLDRTMWSRVQYLGLVQAAAFTTAYAFRGSHRYIACGVFLMAMSLTAILYFMMRRDEAIRDANRPLLELLGRELSEYLLKGVTGAIPAAFAFGPKPSWPASFRGRDLNVALFCLFVALDLAAIVYLLLFVGKLHGM